MRCLLGPKMEQKHDKMDLEIRLSPQGAPASFLHRFRWPNWSSKSLLIVQMCERTHSENTCLSGLFFKWFSAPNVSRMLFKNNIKTKFFCRQARKGRTAFRLRRRERIEGRTLPKTTQNTQKTTCEPTRLESQPWNSFFGGFWSARWTSGKSKTTKNDVASRFVFSSFFR